MAEESMAHLTVNGHRPRVAIVGASPAGTTVATILIEQFGCDPVCARTGEAVLSLLRRDSDIDLVVLDLAMDDMDGIVAVQLIRAMGGRGGMPVIAMTDNRASLAAPRARAAGFSGAVIKPYSPRELYAAMDTALARTHMPVEGHA
jgi:CheY-like chemotaxis protein